VSRAARHRLTALVLVVLEVWFFVRYAAGGAEFHYWLHALLGGALGLSLLTVLRLLHPRGEARQWRAHEATLVGHLWSAVPDVLFLAGGVLHASWMDVFSLHITAHFLWPGPLQAALVLWTLAVLAWVAARTGARRSSAAALLVAVAFLAVAGALREPVPRTLQQVVEGGSNGAVGGGRAWVWVCDVQV
jgi:hypothetical protein